MKKIIPTGSTYKIRNGIYESNGIRFFPSYTQTGDSFGLEKSKVEMIKEDIGKAIKIINKTKYRQKLLRLTRLYA